jgi:hypothetical protein
MKRRASLLKRLSAEASGRDSTPENLTTPRFVREVLGWPLTPLQERVFAELGVVALRVSVTRTVEPRPTCGANATHCWMNELATEGDG